MTSLTNRIAVAAGAGSLHLHPRRQDGSESLRAEDVGAAVAAVRERCPKIPVGVTTALWVTGDAAARQEQVAGWTHLDPARRPDFASVNVSEEGWQDLTVVLERAGIGAEAGVWSAADARAAGPAGGWLRILVEISGVSAAEAAGRADEILGLLQAGGVTAPVLLHGEDDSCWPLLARAGQLGLPTRIGLEDVLSGPDGQDVADNAELIRLALAEWTAARTA